MSKTEEYVVYYHCDPRILGDYVAEVYKIAEMLGSKEELMKWWNETKTSRKLSGNRARYYAYPTKNTQNHTQGQKITLIPAAHPSYYPEETDNYT